MTLKYKIGDTVRVKRFTTMGYQNDDYNNSKVPSLRKAFKNDELPIPLFMTVIGAVRRQCGEYKPAYQFNNDFGEHDYEPACLIVSKTVMLYQVRKGMFGKIRDVTEEDLEGVDAEGKINGKAVLTT